MTQEEFMRKNLMRELDALKVPYAESLGLVEEGIRYWMATARFSRGAWVETLAHVKKKIGKQSKRSGR